MKKFDHVITSQSVGSKGFFGFGSNSRFQPGQNQTFFFKPHNFFQKNRFQVLTMFSPNFQVIRSLLAGEIHNFFVNYIVVY